MSAEQGISQSSDELELEKQIAEFKAYLDATKDSFGSLDLKVTSQIIVVEETSKVAALLKASNILLTRQVNDLQIANEAATKLSGEQQDSIRNLRTIIERVEKELKSAKGQAGTIISKGERPIHRQFCPPSVEEGDILALTPVAVPAAETGKNLSKNDGGGAYVKRTVFPEGYNPKRKYNLTATKGNSCTPCQTEGGAKWRIYLGIGPKSDPF